jgi:hypothetical protein
MTAGLDDCGYVLIYEIGGEQHIETFYTEQEMEQFIAENNVRPLFHYKEERENGYE